MSNIDVNIENIRRLQELVDKNNQKIPEGDYLALCDITKKLYAVSYTHLTLPTILRV